MNMIVKYMLVKARGENGLSELDTEVEWNVGYGWQPYGSLVAVFDGQNIRYIQPMVMYEEVDDE